MTQITCDVRIHRYSKVFWKSEIRWGHHDGAHHLHEIVHLKSCLHSENALMPAPHFWVFSTINLLCQLFFVEKVWMKTRLITYWWSSSLFISVDESYVIEKLKKLKYPSLCWNHELEFYHDLKRKLLQILCWPFECESDYGKGCFWSSALSASRYSQKHWELSDLIYFAALQSLCETS